MMAEAIAMLSFVSAVAGLIDIGQKLLRRLGEFHSDTRDVPKSFRHMAIRLPTVEDGLRRLESRAKDGQMDSDSQKALIPTISGCHERIESLLDILDEFMPRVSDSSFTKAIKAARSLRRDKQVQTLTTDIDRYLTSLTFHNTCIGGNLISHPVTQRSVDMTPSGRDPNFVDRPDLMVALASKMKLNNRVALAGIGGTG